MAIRGGEMNIYLLRHGQTNINRDGKYQSAVDKNLNEFGMSQAELLGKRLKSYCGISILKYNYLNNKMTVKCINDTGHLDDLI